jgi:hypothetical protein
MGGRSKGDIVMRLRRLLLSIAALAGLAGLALLAQDTGSPGVRMSEAAEKWLATLEPEQVKRATFQFDDKERTNWNFIPLQDKDKKATRKGLPLEAMNAEQKEAARALIAAGTSSSGYAKVTGIMALESILFDLEKNRNMIRNPEWYFFSVFGTPSKTGRWGLRIEGHHLSLNFTIDGGQIVSATPAFFGANPAVIKTGPRQGQRTLPEAEDHAKALFASLTAEQRQAALQKEQFPEIEQAKPAATVGEPVGLPASKMTDAQKELLRKLIEGYAGRMPPAVAADQLARVKAAGLERVHFAFAQEDKPGQPYTYRVHGPTFLIEFLNVQADSEGNPANHIHSAWRTLPGDFGLVAAR